MSLELVIGLVGAIGVDFDEVTRALERELANLDYKVKPIHLIELLEQFPRWEKSFATERFDRRCHVKMDAGNEFREALKLSDAVARLGLVAIENERKKLTGEPYKPPGRVAYLLRSLKLKAEVELLRGVYGPNLVLIALYSPKEIRLNRLKLRIAQSHHTADNERYLTEAHELVRRDEVEHGNEYGQNVRDTFPLADVFIDASRGEAIAGGIKRFTEILFGHPFRTPRQDECGMQHAYVAGMRSASAGRQVGAAIVTPDGDLVSVGTNEVARAGGGQYWDGNSPDHRDHVDGVDVSAKLVEHILADTLARLKKKGWLGEAHASMPMTQLLISAQRELLKPMVPLNDEPESLSESAKFGHVIEYIRAVHAEMAALMSAARRGVSVQGCTLYSTAFPCHECARHIVAAGIAKVYFIEPYPKSRVSDLFSDSIVVDAKVDDARVLGDPVPFSAYIGLSPTQYGSLFAAPERRASGGGYLDWEKIKRDCSPRLGNPHVSYIVREQENVHVLDAALIQNQSELQLMVEGGANG